MLPEQKLDALVTRHKAIESELSTQLAPETFVKLSREFAELNPVVDAVKAYRDVVRGFRGQIELTGRLILGEGSRVDAKVVADSAEIAGEFKGELKVRSLILLEKGRLEGNLETQSLAVRDGAQLNGAVNAGIGKATTVRQAVTPPPAAPGNVATG